MPSVMARRASRPLRDAAQDDISPSNIDDRVMAHLQCAAANGV